MDQDPARLQHMLIFSHTTLSNRTKWRRSEFNEAPTMGLISAISSAAYCAVSISGKRLIRGWSLKVSQSIFKSYPKGKHLVGHAKHTGLLQGLQRCYINAQHFRDTSWVPFDHIPAEKKTKQLKLGFETAGSWWTSYHPRRATSTSWLTSSYPARSAYAQLGLLIS